MERPEFNRIVEQLGEDEAKGRLLDACMSSTDLFQDKYYGDTEAIQDVFEINGGMWEVFVRLRDEFKVDVVSYLKGKDIK